MHPHQSASPLHKNPPYTCTRQSPTPSHITGSRLPQPRYIVTVVHIPAHERSLAHSRFSCRSSCRLMVMSTSCVYVGAEYSHFSAADLGEPSHTVRSRVTSQSHTAWPLSRCLVHHSRRHPWKASSVRFKSRRYPRVARSPDREIVTRSISCSRNGRCSPSPGRRVP